MNQQAEVVVAGLLCLDIIPELFDAGSGALFAPGLTTESGPLTLALGGAVANTGLALYKLGITPRLVGRVGPDMAGQVVRRLLQSYAPELADNLIIAPDEITSYTVVLSPPGRDRHFIHAPGCNATFGLDDLDFRALAQARLFHFGYPPLMRRVHENDGAELVEIFRQAKATGVTTALDMAMPDMTGPAGKVNWPKLLGRALPYVDVFVPSLEELLVMLDQSLAQKLERETVSGGLLDRISPELVSAMGQQLLDMGAKIVGLKAGYRGMYLRTAETAKLAGLGRGAPADLKAWANRELWLPCFATQVVGTTGSGDATIAGFFLGLLRGMTPEEALRAACATGACNVEAADALSGIRSWPEITARLETGWPHLALSLDAPGWREDTNTGLWYGPADKKN